MEKEDKTFAKIAENVCYYLVGIMIFLTIIGTIKL